jgi:putative transposase
MKKSKFTETQIVKAILDHEAGRKAEDICRELGITVGSPSYSHPTLSLWLWLR